jgi:hypothetical protein
LDRIGRVIRCRLAIITAAAMLALVSGCGHLPPCPAAGGPTWTELSTDHFRLRTDEDPEAARGRLTELERLRAALLTVFRAPADLDTGRLPVIVVDRGWTDFAAREVEGYFTHAVAQPLIVLAASSRAFQVDVIKHELVHYLSAQVIPNQPPWFAEGIATYYQTVEFDEDAHRIDVGRPSEALLARAQQIGLPAIERIFTAKAIEHEEAPSFYAAAWLSVHYLMNHRASALSAYAEALRAGVTGDAAWTAAFGAQTPAQLAREIQQYADGGHYEVLQFPIDGVPPPAPAERPLSDADTHATRALLYLTGTHTRTVAPELSLGADDQKPAAEREIEEALRAQPDHVLAGAIAHFIFNAPVDIALARRATQSAPNDWLAWLLLADGLRQRGDAAGWNDAVVRARDLARSDRSVMLQVMIVERN